MYKLLLSLLYLLKQLYINNKTERPSHKVGVVYVGIIIYVYQSI